MRHMKVLFANPPTFENEGAFFRPVRFPTFNYATPVMHPPIYLAYAAAYARHCGHDIALIDAPVKALKVTQFINQVTEYGPDVVVFETSTPSFANDLKVATLLKSEIKNITMVFMGTHVTALPYESLSAKAVDVIIMGEYEFSLQEYLEKGPTKTSGIGYKDNQGNITINPPREACDNLDVVPQPARDLLPNYSYFDPILKNPFTFVISGRGCPYGCTFCNWPEHLTGKRIRKRSPQKIVDEIESLQNYYDFKSFLFNDDTFTADKSHAISVAEEMIRREITIPWGCYARADFDDEEALKLFKKAGCFLLKIGIESADEEIQKNVRKNYDLKKVQVSVKKMHALGFHVHGTFAFGLPGETKKTILKTIRFSKELALTTVQFSVAVPYPGTEYYDFLKKNSYLLTNDWSEYMPLRPVFEYPHLSFKQMHSLLRFAYRSYYLRPKYVGVGLKQFIQQPHVFLRNAKKLAILIFKKD